MPLLDYLPPFERAVEAFLDAPPSPITTVVPVTSFHDPSDRETTTATYTSSLEDTDIFLSRLDSAVEKLATLRRLHQQRRTILHNAIHVPLLGLPVEITGRIFGFAIGNKDPLSRLHHLARVCSQWFRVARSWGPLFTQLDLHQLKGDSQIESLIKKTGGGPLDISASYAHVETIHHNASRIRSLQLYLDNVMGLLQGHTQPFDRLEVLSLDLGYDGIKYDLSDWSLPALRQLSLYHTLHQYIIPPSIPSQLRFLSFRRLRSKSSTKGLYEFLVCCKHLEGLELLGASFMTFTPFKEGIKGTSHSLRYLRIVDTSASSSAVFLHQLSCPNLQTLYINDYDIKMGTTKSDSEDEFGYGIVTFDLALEMERFLRRSPLLHTLIFDSQYGRSAELFMIFATAVYHDSITLHSNPLLLNLQTLRLLDSAEYARNGHDKPLIRALHTRHQRNNGTLSSFNLLLDPTPLSPSSIKVPIHVEMGRAIDTKNRSWYEERVESVEHIIEPDRRPHPEWYL